MIVYTEVNLNRHHPPLGLSAYAVIKWSQQLRQMCFRQQIVLIVLRCYRMLSPYMFLMTRYLVLTSSLISLLL